MAPGEGAGVEVVEGRVYLAVLYGDYEGGQRVVSRFGVLREDDGWKVTTVRHWQLDRPNPR